MSRAAALAAIVALLLATASLSAQRAPAPAGVVVTPGTFPVSGTPVAVEEGRFTVPADRASDTAGSITLAFVRFRSTAASPGAPIVFLAGGPGDAATRALRGIPLDHLRELRAIADVIAFDQRGTGRSEPFAVRCPPGPALPHGRPADPATMVNELRGRVRGCLDDAARHGLHVSGLTTAESADDLEALRGALGAERLALLAGSYGTHLALAAARRHPALVARMALLGVEGPDHTLKLPSRVDEVLAAVARERRPSLPDDVRTLRARLAAAPARHLLPDGRTIVLGEWDLQRWMAESVDAVPEIEAMLAAIPTLLAGDHAALARWALADRAPRWLSLTNLAMDCASYASAGRLARIRAEAPAALLGDAINLPLPALCDVPGLPRLPDDFRAPLTSDVPALLVSGAWDGRTPPANAAEVARGMPRARLLVVERASHALFREAEALRAVVAFLGEGRR